MPNTTHPGGIESVVGVDGKSEPRAWNQVHAIADVPDCAVMLYLYFRNDKGCKDFKFISRAAAIIQS